MDDRPGQGNEGPDADKGGYDMTSFWCRGASAMGTWYVDDERIRLVSDSHGAIWDSEFTVRQHAGATELTLTMDARPHAFLARMMVPIIPPGGKGSSASVLWAISAFLETLNSMASASTQSCNPSLMSINDRLRSIIDRAFADEIRLHGYAW